VSLISWFGATRLITIIPETVPPFYSAQPTSVLAPIGCV